MKISDFKPGQEVRLKVKNVMWPYRDRYAPGVIRDEYQIFEGKIVFEKWFNNQVGLTTDLPHFPMRVINVERIVEVDGKKSKFDSQSLQTSNNGERRRINVKGSRGNLYQVEVGGDHSALVQAINSVAIVGTSQRQKRKRSHKKKKRG